MSAVLFIFRLILLIFSVNVIFLGLGWVMHLATQVELKLYDCDFELDDFDFELDDYDYELDDYDYESTIGELAWHPCSESF